MKQYPAFEPGRGDVIALLASQTMGRLVTIDETGLPRVGLHVFVHRELDIEVHLVSDDPQFADVVRGSPVVFEVDDVLAFSPSHWIDPHDGSHADQFYRCVVLRGATEVVADTAAVAEHLRTLIGRVQPEGQHEVVDDGSPLYAAAIRRLGLVRIRGEISQAKFKLAQRTGAPARTRIVEKLHERGSSLDHKTAMMVARGTRRKSD